MEINRVHVPSTNLRELGGYQTRDGSFVKYGCIFRCGHMSELTSEEEDMYRGLKLGLIIDLRRDDEVAERPTPLFGSEENIHISVSDPDNAFAEAAAKAAEPEPVSTQAHELGGGGGGVRAIDRSSE